VIPEGIRLGIVRGISYGLFGKPDTFMPQLRELGATLVRFYVYWSQVEPEPGHYTFDVVDGEPAAAAADVHARLPAGA
jgi:hypothetical protein